MTPGVDPSGRVNAWWVAAAAVWFAFTGAVSGEFNYQGGGYNRRTFYTRFPFDSPQGAWDTPGYGGTVATDGSAAVNVLTEREAPIRFARNLEYFLIGRHFGLVPYFFPGIVIVAAWLLSSARRDPWRVLTFLAFAASALGLLLLTPYTWSGGGVGNRYFFGGYGVMLFALPPLQSLGAAFAQWAIGSGAGSVKLELTNLLDRPIA